MVLLLITVCSYFFCHFVGYLVQLCSALYGYVLSVFCVPTNFLNFCVALVFFTKVTPKHASWTVDRVFHQLGNNWKETCYLQATGNRWLYIHVRKCIYKMLWLSRVKERKHAIVMEEQGLGVNATLASYNIDVVVCKPFSPVLISFC